MEPLMPTVTGRSRPWTDHRLAVEGMAWKYRTGAPWRDVPERFGKWNSVYKRFNRWAENGTSGVRLGVGRAGRGRASNN
jgi:transposase